MVVALVNEWETEPNRLEGEYKGYRWVILRNTSFLHLCGYVGLPAGHDFYGKDYSDLGLSAHGGLTFASDNGGFLPDGYWWIGFDCAHYGDLSPGIGRTGFSPNLYRNIEYVRNEIYHLIDQLPKLPEPFSRLQLSLRQL